MRKSLDGDRTHWLLESPVKSAPSRRVSSPLRIVLTYFSLLAMLIVLVPTLGHARTWGAFGPKTYTRGSGAPVTVTDTFTLLNPATQYTLRAFNAALQANHTELPSNTVILPTGTHIVITST